MTDNSCPKNYMVDKGIKVLFANNRYSRRDDSSFDLLVKDAIIKDKELLSPSLFHAVVNDESDYLTSLLKHAENTEVNLFELPFWQKPIDILSSKLLSEDTVVSEIVNGYRDYAVSAAMMKDSYQWDELFNRVYSYQRSNNYIRGTFLRILSGYADNFSDSFKDFSESEVFFSKTKPAYAARGAIYSQYIKSGFLTTKTARKIRSDASSDASVAGLKALLKSKDLYPEYDDLLLQFTDSKYDEVICLLASGLPDYLITSIMGTQSYWPKKAVEERLERIEAEREASAESESQQELY